MIESAAYTLKVGKKCAGESFNPFEGTKERKKITILADKNNSSAVFVGNEQSQNFPLYPGNQVELVNTRIVDIWFYTPTSGQNVYLITS
ncbi:MAG: hypothetical protein JTT12_05490 [Candidatus Brockarchaeota archaeon]|nr:hypothetical protein [Candidatus Brockarchaeota archaeon]